MCREEILSEQTYDYITDVSVDTLQGLLPILCHEEVDNIYSIVYLDGRGLPGFESAAFEYQGIPKLYGLMQIEGDSPVLPPGYLQPPFDPAALIACGISQIQGPPLKLTGFGTMICFIDTGIDYTNPVFRDEMGNTRIAAIWDQTIQEGNPPEGFLYGTEYTRDQINRALRAEDPRSIVPSVDEIGHGTALASVACGSSAYASSYENYLGEDDILPNGNKDIAKKFSDAIPAGFRGAAPDAEIVVVKLKDAKQNLKDYYQVPREVLAFQENDIMLAVKYCERFVRIFQRPVVICIGMGTSFGDHSGTSPLSVYLNNAAVSRNRAVVVCGGNEGNSAHHYRGSFSTGDTDSGLPDGSLISNARDVEIRVADGNSGFYMELWGQRTNVINVSIRSPGGEVIPPIPLGLKQSITFGFIYERTQLTIYSTLVEPSSGDELISFRFEDPTPGIWTIRVIGQTNAEKGIFDLWLPLGQFQSAPVYFLSPSPEITLTEPGMAPDVITVSAYQTSNSGFYIDSGRGFSRTGLPRPDITAPGVDIFTVYGKQSGSGFAAALTSGAVAQFFQWAVVEGNNYFADSRVIKSYLIRGAKRNTNINYPSREWGYGRLDMEGVFASIRV